MQRLDNGYIARIKEIGMDFFAKIATDRTLAGETQDFYQGLLAGFDEVLKISRALPDKELLPTLELLESKLATMIDTSLLSSSPKKPVPHPSRIPFVGRLSPDYIEQLSGSIRESDFGQVVNNIVKDEETQDFYCGCIAAVDFASRIADNEYACAAIGFMKINVANHIQLEREANKQVSAVNGSLLENYAQVMEAYSVEPVKSGFIRYQSSTGVGVIAKFDNYSTLKPEKVEASVYSYESGAEREASAFYQDLSSACSDFVSRLQRLGGRVDEVDYFTSPLKMKKLRAHLLAAYDELAQQEEADVVSRAQLLQSELERLEMDRSVPAPAHGAAMLDTNNRVYLLGGIAESSPPTVENPELVDELLLGELENPDEELEELSPFARELVGEMEDWLVNAAFSSASSPPDSQYQLQRIKDWTVYLEDGGYIRVVANSDNHLVLRATLDGEITSALSYNDAVKLNSELEAMDEEDLEQEEEDFEQAVLEVDEIDWDALELDDSSSYSVEVQPDAQQLEIANQILPIALKFRAAYGVSLMEEGKLPVGGEYNWEQIQQLGVTIASLVASDGRGELIQIRNGKVVSARRLTQEDLDIWAALGERLEHAVLSEVPIERQHQDSGSAGALEQKSSKNIQL